MRKENTQCTRVFGSTVVDNDTNSTPTIGEGVEIDTMVQAVEG